MKNRGSQYGWSKVSSEEQNEGQDAEARLRSGAQELRLHAMTKRAFIKGL